MDRLEPVPLEKMNPIQRALYDRIASQRSGGQVTGPFAVLLHTPEICDPVSSFIDHLMSDTRLPHNLKEITILAIAKAYSAPYEWVVHERRARRAGVLGSVIEAIRKGNRPYFNDPDEKLVFEHWQYDTPDETQLSAIAPQEYSVTGILNNLSCFRRVCHHI